MVRGIPDDHDVDQTAQPLQCLGTAVLSGQRAAECPDALSVLLRKARVHNENVMGIGLGEVGDKRRPLRLAGFQGVPNLVERGGAGGDRVDQAGDLRIERVDPVTRGAVRAGALATQALAFLVIAADDVSDDVGREELVGETREDALLEPIETDAPAVATGTGLAVTRAGETVARDDRVCSTAVLAADEAGERMSRSLLLAHVEPVAIGAPVLDRLPALLVDDPQLRMVGLAPVGLGIETGNALPRLEMLDHPDAVVEQPPGIDRVVQDADSPAARPDDRRRPPLAPARGRDVLGVQLVRDLAGRDPREELAIDSADDVGLLVDDTAPAALDRSVREQDRIDGVAVAEATGHLAARDLAELAATDLRGNLLDLDRVHRPLQADVQLGYRAVRERENLRAGELETLEDRRAVGLVARQPIEILDKHDVEGALVGCRQHRDQPRPLRLGARDSEVGVDAGDIPALTLGPIPAKPRLILGGALVLHLGREAGVDGGTETFGHSGFPVTIRCDHLRARHPRAPCRARWRRRDRG